MVNYKNIRTKLRMLGRMRRFQRKGLYPRKFAKRTYYKKIGYKKPYYKRRYNRTGFRKSFPRGSKERVILPWNNYQNGDAPTYLGQLPSIASTYAGSVSGAVALKILQTGDRATSTNDTLNADLPNSVSLMGGFLATSGVANINGLGEIVGKSAIMTSAFIRFTITMNMNEIQYNPDQEPDRVFSQSLPHDFRVLIVRAKRQNSVDAQVPIVNNALLTIPALRSNLFINENGMDRGLADDTSVADLFNWRVNHQKWEKVHEDRFTLKAMILPYTAGNTGSGVYTRLGLDGTPLYPATKTIKHYLNVPKKRVDFSFQSSTTTPATGNPTNFNYVYHTVVLSRLNGFAGNLSSNNWSIQATGSTALLD